ncbi:uncharacterized protein LOC116802030 isoform X1 [Drosophila sechellia]|uniref:uncharacterized protein LOC116802030 isoform X1 n=1 Tax=Drosophila sechellia TaxID=7238 RepID=UPI0013DE6D3A|nr:uncharacterized protein LOC116802030 isoform X1 [Drosophila sechellia]
MNKNEENPWNGCNCIYCSCYCPCSCSALKRYSSDESSRCFLLQKGLKYRYECERCSDPRCPLSKAPGMEIRLSHPAESTSRAPQQKRSFVVQSCPSDKGRNSANKVKYSTPKYERETDRESSISTPFSCYKEDIGRTKSSDKYKFSGNCNCFTTEQPRKFVSRTAEEIRRAVRAEIADMEQKKAKSCNCTSCKPPQSVHLSANERTKSKSKDEDIFTESEKLLLGKIDWRTTATDDLTNSELIYSTIKHLLRICLNNKIIELGLLDSLHEAVALFKENRRKRDN